MPSLTVQILQAQLALVDVQINTLLQSPTPLTAPPGAIAAVTPGTPPAWSPLIDHSVDSQNFQENAALDRLFERKEKLLVLLRKSLPYELRTRTLLT